MANEIEEKSCKYISILLLAADVPMGAEVSSTKYHRQPLIAFSHQYHHGCRNDTICMKWPRYGLISQIGYTEKLTTIDGNLLHAHSYCNQHELKPVLWPIGTAPPYNRRYRPPWCIPVGTEAHRAGIVPNSISRRTYHRRGQYIAWSWSVNIAVSSLI